MSGVCIGTALMEMASFSLSDCNVKGGVQRIDYVRATYVWMQTEGTRTDPKDTRMLLVIAWRREATCMHVNFGHVTWCENRPIYTRFR